MDKDNKNKYLGAEVILEKLRLLEELLKTKLTEEQIEVINQWCKKDENVILCENDK